MYARTLIVAVAAASAAASAVAAPLSAQWLAAVPARTFVARSIGGDEPNAARIRAMLEKADESLVAGKLGEAKKAYRNVIDEQRAAGLYAGEALWHLASTYFFLDDNSGAADALDELAADAAHFGDPSMELRATFESAILNQNMHRSSGVAAKFARVKALLQSPAIGDAQKSEVTQRIAKE
jgi:hypothetical protein